MKKLQDQVSQLRKENKKLVETLRETIEELRAVKHTEGKLFLCEKWDDENYEIGTEDQDQIALVPIDGENSLANAARLVKCWNMHDELMGALEDLVNWVEIKEINETPGFSFNQAKTLLELIKQSNNNPNQSL